MNNNRNTELLIKFGLVLKELRVQRNLTQEALAFEANIEISQVYRIEKGKLNVTLSTLNLLSNALNISLSELMLQLERELSRVSN
ncbi:MAG: helix-turn-helix domain-containing protein [Chitinophagaceae bacterium]